MMFLFAYKTGLLFFRLALMLAFPFHSKARIFLKGRRDIFDTISSGMKNDTREKIWFHCASLGEFEQARPVIEECRRLFPSYSIILTFFSPSGYEVRKNYSGADHVFYLPLDSRHNAEKFVSLTNPVVALFAKYEFWFFYLYALHQAKIPSISFSAIFREEQLFFKPYASEYRKLLTWFGRIFVQDNKSRELLAKFEINQTSVSGDTRFDRVACITQTRINLPVAEDFCRDSLVLVVGSSWPEDISILSSGLIKLADRIRIIIAPHEISEDSLRKTEKQVGLPVVRYSKASGKDLTCYNVLLVDNIGLLSSLYSYGHIAYVGGAFGKGLHNILEAAAWGVPVVFGAKYGKFREAKELLELEGAISVTNEKEAEKTLIDLVNNEPLRVKKGEIAGRYVKENTGATAKIIAYLEEVLIR